MVSIGIILNHLYEQEVNLDRAKVIPLKDTLIKMIAYGTPGTGKTQLCASFNTDPRTGPALHLDIYGNVAASLRDDPSWVVATITDPVQIDTVYNFFRQGQPASHALRRELDIAPDIVFKSLTIDTVSDLQRLQIERLLGKPSDESIMDTPAPKLPDWTKIAMLTLTPIRQLVYLPGVHVVLTLQEYTALDIEQATTKARPFLLGQAIQMVPGYVELSGRMQWQRVTSGPESDDKELAIVTTFRAPSDAAFVKNNVSKFFPNKVKWATATKLVDALAEAHEQASKA
jgi:hypothetical protein